MQDNRKRDMEKHPTRQELIAATTRGTGVYDQHLAVCSECRELFELFAAFPMAGELPLPDAPAVWIAKAKEIAEAANPLRTLQGLMAKLSFDSWKEPSAVGIRSHEAVADRRVVFEAGSLTVDVRAERQGPNWEFTAQIRCDKGNPAAVTILADKQVIMPDANGFYQWSSTRPPRSIRLQADNTSVALPELSWKETPEK